MSVEMCQQCDDDLDVQTVPFRRCNGCSELLCLHMLDAEYKCSVCEPGEGE